MIDVSGANGGGQALIGGGAHGANSAIPDATNTTVQSGAVIDADATADGNGGQVVVWSNNLTDFEGSISARGGANGGNGGFAEVLQPQPAHLQRQGRPPRPARPRGERCSSTPRT